MTYSNILQIDDDSDDCELFMEALEAVSPANYTAICNKDLKEIPVIIFSTSQLDDIIREAKAYGAHDFISKPNNFNDLKKILSQYTFSA